MGGWKSWHGDKIIVETTDAMDKAAMDAAHAIHGDALEQVPHDTGYLSKSGIVLPDPTNSAKWHIGFGGGGQSGKPVVPYAVRWHENRADFQKGRKHNYLRDPVRKNGRQYMMDAATKRAKEVW